MQTCRKIVNWRQHLRFPEEVAVPPLARDLICRLLCDVEQRLGSHGGAAEIRVSPALAHKPHFHVASNASAFRWAGPAHLSPKPEYKLATLDVWRSACSASLLRL
jgi:hypothetical protein